MALQSLWIRKHMLQSPSSDSSHQERQLSENEKRVLLSIQKLSIPEWYLNNNSRPPKILSNDTPIDQRPAAWKNMSAKASPEPETPVVQPNNSTVCLNGVLKTKIESSSNAKKNNVTDKTNRSSPTKSPIKQNVSPKNQNPDGSPGKLRRANISQTFPRLSPSRKIQNINIVFPQEMANTKRLMITDLDDLPDTSVNDMTVDSLEVQKEEKDELGDTETWDSHGENSPEENVSSPEEPEDVIVAGSGLHRKSGEAKRRSPVCLFLVKKKSPTVEIPKPGKNDSELQKSQLPVRSRDSTEKSPVDDCTGARTSERASKGQAAPPPKKSGGVKRKLCGCSNATPARQPLGSGPRVSSFRPKTMLPPIPEIEFTFLPERQNVYPNKCPTRPLFRSTVKTVRPKEIVADDADSSSVSQTSLASDIIEELNQRCSAKSQATPSSKNFVKKLVTALENEVRQAPKKIEKIPYEESIDYNAKETFLHDETFIFGENSSEDEINTVAMSTSISFKGSDSSGSTPGSPIIMNGDDNVYDWNSATNRNNELPKNNNERQVVNGNLETIGAFDDDEWMYWHQNSEWNYPRTSSRLSSVSSQSVDHSGPCVSPIDQPNHLNEAFSTRSKISSSNGWDTIYRTRKTDTDSWCTVYKTRKTDTTRTWRLNGTIVLDSGYSDRSSSPPSSYTEETTSFNYTGTTLTASETSSYCHDDSPERSMSPFQPEEQMRRRSIMI